MFKKIIHSALRGLGSPSRRLIDKGLQKNSLTPHIVRFLLKYRIKG